MRLGYEGRATRWIGARTSKGTARESERQWLEKRQVAPSERSEAPLRDSAARTHRGDGGDANITGEQIGGAACSGGGGMTVAFGRERRRERESEKISYGVPMGGGGGVRGGAPMAFAGVTVFSARGG